VFILNGRASPVIIVKIAIEKVQLFTLATVFSILFLIDYIFYYLFSLNTILCGSGCERKRERKCARKK
jgi:hypothetical protein